MAISATAQIALLGGVFLCLCLAAPILVTFQQVGKMRQGIHLRRLPEQAVTAAYERFRAEADWALAKGFAQFEGMYTFVVGAAAFVAAWRHMEHPTYFVLLSTGPKKFFVFLTEFSEHSDLVTGSAKHFQLFPKPPGHYVQTFSKLSLDDLFARHLAAARYVTTAGAVQVKPTPWAFEDAFTKGEALQAAYLQSLPFWFLRAPYWYYVRKTRFHNKAIERLHKSGMLQLPNDRGFENFT